MQSAAPDECASAWARRELGVRWSDRTGCGEDRTITFEHHETGVLVGQPPECSERHHTVRADDNQPFQAVPDAWKSCTMTACTNPVFENQVPAIDPDLDSICRTASRRRDAALVNCGIARNLGYGFRSCHRSSPSIGR